MTSARRRHYSYEEYLRALDVSELKLEFCDGTIYAMAGGTKSHAELAARIIRLLGNALDGVCRVYSSDLKVRVEATDLSTFPDATVICGPVATAAIDSNAIINPTLLVEVTSRSTEDYDRGEKLSNYKQLPSLQAVLIASHRRPQITMIERTDAGFIETERRSGERLTLTSPALDVRIDDIYRGVELEAIRTESR